MALNRQGARRTTPAGQAPGMRFVGTARVQIAAAESPRSGAAAIELNERHIAEYTKFVCMLCPGGFEHAGGIGRWAGYLFTVWPDADTGFALGMMDTRGFGGRGIGILAFARVVIELVWLRCTGRLGLIHANLSVRGSTFRKWFISMLASWLGVPLILHLHSGRFLDFYADLPGWARLAVRRMFARAARVIVLGKIWNDAVAGQLGVPRDKIMILLNGVLDPRPSPRQSRPTDVCHIVMLGRLGPKKGVPELLEALGSVALCGLPWRLTLAGDGESAPYRTQAASLGIADRLVFAGWLDAPAVSALLSDADVLVLPSHSENLSVAVIEALAHRVAVVTTPVGATPEIVANNESALLVPVRDPQALADALRRLIIDPEMRARISSAGRRVFEERLDIRRSADALAQIYATVIAEADQMRARRAAR